MVWFRKENNILSGTKIRKEEAEKLTEHTDPQIRDLATRWLDKHAELQERFKQRVNILPVASSLMTIDSQLYYILEDIEKDKDN